MSGCSTNCAIEATCYRTGRSGHSIGLIPNSTSSNSDANKNNVTSIKITVKVKHLHLFHGFIMFAIQEPTLLRVLNFTNFEI